MECQVEREGYNNLSAALWGVETRDGAMLIWIIHKIHLILALYFPVSLYVTHTYMVFIEGEEVKYSRVFSCLPKDSNLWLFPNGVSQRIEMEIEPTPNNIE